MISVIFATKLQNQQTKKTDIGHVKAAASSPHSHARGTPNKRKESRSMRVYSDTEERENY
jgi:hypothetical protein